MRDVFPSLRGVFGSWIFYPILMKPEQVNRLILQSNEIRESPTLDDYLQRSLTSNLSKIRSYIVNREDRFFNSIIVGVFNDVPSWSSLDLSKVDFLESELEAIEDSMGLLSLSGGEKLFAIDGQHRVEAVKSMYLHDTSYDDQISVTLVAHVDNVKGKKRTRRLFSDINKKAQNVSQGELVIIDEEEIENIVARRVYADLEKRYEGCVAVTKTAAVNKSDEYFVNLITIAKVTAVFSKHLSLKKKCDPSEHQVLEVLELTKRYFDFIISAEVREALASKTVVEEREEKLNVLFRPIGQEIMAQVYVACIESRSLGHFKEKFPKIDLALSSRYFLNVIYTRKRLVSKNSKLSRDLLLYALGVINKKQIFVPEGFEDDFLNGKLIRLS
tara:strand:- start:10201 stop:11358 length:1158 start_codon:yes stop_codon:yes gene_type:complete